MRNLAHYVDKMIRNLRMIQFSVFLEYSLLVYWNLLDCFNNEKL